MIGGHSYLHRLIVFAFVEGGHFGDHCVRAKGLDERVKILRTDQLIRLDGRKRLPERIVQIEKYFHLFADAKRLACLENNFNISALDINSVSRI